MELKEYIKRTLIEIHEGVAEAITEHSASGKLGGISVAFKKPDGLVDWEAHVRDVTFDVAITVSNEIAKSGKSGIHIASLAEIGGAVSGKNENSQVNKIKFDVPLLMPAQVFENDK